MEGHLVRSADITLNLGMHVNFVMWPRVYNIACMSEHIYLAH